LVADQPFLNVHQALAIFSQARADTISLLSLPRSYGLSRCLEWQQALRRRLGLPDLAGGFAFDEPEEVADLSFVAVYHPWLLVADAAAAARVRSVPPDGAIAGLIAARERQRQAWIAPANLPLQEVLGLSTALSDDDWAELFAQRFNLVRPEAAGFAPMSAHTLSGESALLQISVRRLLILLRKAALQLGMDFVFQPNHELFRQGMRVVLEDFLRFLFQRGAFAGGSEAESFRVIADDTVNPPQSVEQGRLVVVIQVAPSQPMEFITVQLLRSGEGELLATEV
jgi:phage tail sheath protein FI